MYRPIVAIISIFGMILGLSTNVATYFGYHNVELVFLAGIASIFLTMFLFLVQSKLDDSNSSTKRKLERVSISSITFRLILIVIMLYGVLATGH